ncbi:EEF1A lysine methyltransferase 1-like isoform X2 [Patiria miniata]|nr:EEF1A lysine methyltransferase 1-like isoform X2 [Patiria miniata]XP_038049333.1 EEF1A lysine methyltransferase 1-like isoform X2 [Patiria miniata]XP_038049334.1 EEF1A lysine methyltransferase 1-like isoform X2 [Patiria miniata]
MSDSDDDVPRLSAETMAALQEFYKSQELTEASDVQSGISENWNLSQFWYTDATAEALAKETLRAAGSTGRIACVSCPSLYKKLQQLKPATCTTVLLEFDKRFSVYKDFVFYDFNTPLELANLQKNTFEVVVADPPYLSEECLSKTAQTVRFLSSGKVILCTGAVMEDLAADLLGVTMCSFVPSHARNLANVFRCFTNFDTHYLNQGNS